MKFEDEGIKKIHVSLPKDVHRYQYLNLKPCCMIMQGIIGSGIRGTTWKVSPEVLVIMYSHGSRMVLSLPLSKKFRPTDYP